MLYVTKELAFNMESCIKHTHIEMTKALACGRIHQVGDGVACFAGFSSFFSQVIAWGFGLNCKQFKTQIEAIEHFYRTLGHPHVDIEVCPLVGMDLPIALSERGYTVGEWNNVSYINIKNYSPVLNNSPYHVGEVPSSQLEQWAHQVALGFGHLPAQEQFYHYACLNHVTAFAVYKQEQMIAGGSIALHNGFADLGVTSTLAPYRGRGLQKLLIHARLQHAARLGISTALVTTEPGSISDLNVQKTGFQCAYTRVKFTKKC